MSSFLVRHECEFLQFNQYWSSSTWFKSHLRHLFLFLHKFDHIHPILYMTEWKYPAFGKTHRKCMKKTHFQAACVNLPCFKNRCLLKHVNLLNIMFKISRNKYTYIHTHTQAKMDLNNLAVIADFSNIISVWISIIQIYFFF